ncbi:MAG: GIY-YIG nuclease family protein [Candidatus Saccharibacteria bacterium]|nr:GIY-YIG nuclease family protein [Candidatus Saccharibacteria bacterium]
MAKGIIYVMLTAVSGLVKIGKTNTDNYKERMRHLEANGYYNVVGLKRFLAIELADYDDKESLLHEIFSKYQVGNSELFALDQDLIRQLLLSFDGRVIYPERIKKEKEFNKITAIRKKGALFNFYAKGLKKGDQISFISDNAITAKVADKRTVEYAGSLWKLSPLTFKIYQTKNQQNESGAYQGANYWQYKGKKLKDLPDIVQQ